MSLYKSATFLEQCTKCILYDYDHTRRHVGGTQLILWSKGLASGSVYNFADCIVFFYDTIQQNVITLWGDCGA